MKQTWKMAAVNLALDNMTILRDNTTYMSDNMATLHGIREVGNQGMLFNNLQHREL